MLMHTLVWTILWAPLQAAGPEHDLEPWDLVRVDVPDHPEGVARSGAGSLLLGPPGDGTSWRPEPVPEVDSYVAWEAVEALQSEPWVDAGYDGRGVKVAVFDVQWFNAALAHGELGEVSTWDCYAHPACTVPMDTLRPAFAYEQGSHGVACAEVIRDLAPEVELHLVRVNGLTTLENAVEWAAREGIHLISMSMSFFGDSFYDGSGPVNAAMDVLADAGTLMVTSAGNYAREHWIESFRDDDMDGWHEFGAGADLLPVFFYSAGSHRILLNWDQYRLCGDTDLDLYVFDGAGQVVGRSEKVQVLDGQSCSPTELAHATAAEAGWHYVGVRRAAGDGGVRFSIFARGAYVKDYMSAGSITDPGTHASVLTVGAVRALGYAGNGVEAFSSQGPTRSGLAKPDLVGPNGISSSVYGETGFYGTSASAPAVTAALALVMSRYPELSPREAAAWLKANSLGVSPAWEAPDMALGAGYARLPPLEPRNGGCGERPLLLPALLWFPLASMRRRAGNREHD